MINWYRFIYLFLKDICIPLCWRRRCPPPLNCTAMNLLNLLARIYAKMGLKEKSNRIPNLKTYNMANYVLSVFLPRFLVVVDVNSWYTQGQKFINYFTNPNPNPLRLLDSTLRQEQSSLYWNQIQHRKSNTHLLNVMSFDFQWNQRSDILNSFFLFFL